MLRTMFDETVQKNLLYFQIIEYEGGAYPAGASAQVMFFIAKLAKLSNLNLLIKKARNMQALQTSRKDRENKHAR